MGLIFFWGQMNCGKTCNLLISANKNLDRSFLIKNSVDKRENINFIVSRTNLKIKADLIIDKNTSLLENETIKSKNFNKIIYLDEAQFLTKKQVEELRVLAEEINIYCYGLKTNSESYLFEGSKRLIELADQIIDLDIKPNLCNYCLKANPIINAKLDKNNNIVKIQIILLNVDIII